MGICPVLLGTNISSTSRTKSTFFLEQVNGNEFKFMLGAGDCAPTTFHIRIWWEADEVE
jgi:hypothetical protein